MSQTNTEIIFLDPVCTHNIWGGTRLRTDFGYEVQGETSVSAGGYPHIPNGDGTVRGGSLAG